MSAIENGPCAVSGLTSYRYPSAYGGFIMIGARSINEALSEANRSLELGGAELGKLEVWSAAEHRYVSVKADESVFTFYCGTHRDQVKHGPSPNSVKPGAALAPSCPVCFQTMFWVPNGGTVVPKEETK